MEPKLRIKGFSDNWEVFQMSDVIRGLYNGQTPYRAEPRFWNGDINWISSGDLNRGVVTKSTEKITKEGQENANLRLVPQGTFVLAMTGLEAAGTRGNCGILGIDTTMNQSCMAIFPDDKLLDTHFLFHWYRHSSEDIGIKLTQGTKQQSFNADIIKKIKLCLPKVKEQKAVASFLDQLDELIKISTDKISFLKQIRAASLQSMFPKDGESVPSIRFAGFNEAWNRCKLCDCLDISLDKNINNLFKKEHVLSVSDEEGVMNQIKLLGRSYAGKTLSQYKILKHNQVVYTKSPLKAKPYGIFKVNRGEEGIVSVLYAVYSVREGVSADYINYYFDPSYRVNSYLHPLVNKGAKNTMNISDEMALQGSILMPSYKEQLMIANYFSSIDKQISLYSQRLEKVRQIKSACLDKMFV